MDLLAQPLATAEFLVVDTETNGRAGDACQLTEVGAVLVGGGELHDRWETLVAGDVPLSRAIQRFTQITQEMVDAARPPRPRCRTSPSSCPAASSSLTTPPSTGACSRRRLNARA